MTKEKANMLTCYLTDMVVLTLRSNNIGITVEEEEEVFYFLESFVDKASGYPEYNNCN